MNCRIRNIRFIEENKGLIKVLKDCENFPIPHGGDDIDMNDIVMLTEGGQGSLTYFTVKKVRYEVLSRMGTISQDSYRDLLEQLKQNPFKQSDTKEVLTDVYVIMKRRKR